MERNADDDGHIGGSQASDEGRRFAWRDSDPVELANLVALDPQLAPVGRDAHDVVAANRRNANLLPCTVGRNDDVPRTLLDLRRQIWQLRHVDRMQCCAGHECERDKLDGAAKSRGRPNGPRPLQLRRVARPFRRKAGNVRVSERLTGFRPAASAVLTIHYNAPTRPVIMRRRVFSMPATLPEHPLSADPTAYRYGGTY